MRPSRSCLTRVKCFLRIVLGGYCEGKGTVTKGTIRTSPGLLDRGHDVVCGTQAARIWDGAIVLSPSDAASQEAMVVLKSVEELVLTYARLPELIRFLRTQMLKFVAREHLGQASFIAVQVLVAQLGNRNSPRRWTRVHPVCPTRKGSQAASRVNPSSSLITTQRSSFRQEPLPLSRRYLGATIHQNHPSSHLLYLVNCRSLLGLKILYVRSVVEQGVVRIRCI